MFTVANLRAYQWRAIKFLQSTRYGALLLDMGLGKTISILTLIKWLLLNPQHRVKVWLVVAPLRVVQGVWTQEAHKWQHTQDLQFAIVHGNERERRMALAQPAHVYLINPEGLVWLVEMLHRLGLDKPGRWPFDGLCIDESSMFKASKTKRWKALARVLHLFKRRYILTGTPTPNSMLELWPQIYLVDMGERLGGRFDRFRERFFEKLDYNGYNYGLRPGADRYLNRMVQDIVLRLDAKDYFKLPPVIPNDVYVELPRKVMEMYNRFERTMFLELETAYVEAVSAAVLSMQCHQIANGALWATNDEEERVWEPLHDEKLHAMDEIIGETSSPPLVCYQFKHDLIRLRTKYPKFADVARMNIRVFEKEWNAGKWPGALVHPRSCGHGLNLQDGGHDVVLWSQTWSREQIAQVLARVGPTRQAQAGRYQPVTLHRVIARNTVDEAIVASNALKEAGERALLDALRVYQNAKHKAGGTKANSPPGARRG
jgi:SNF2 family DNA or RNA helicase